MKKLVLAGLALTLLVSPLYAGTRIDPSAAHKPVVRPPDHPRTNVVSSDDIRIDVSTDRIMRSCCQPPDLVITGKITNLAYRSIDYVKLSLVFRDEDGEVVHSEEVYNHQAVSLGEDPMVARVLNEKPHFDPVGAGKNDSFIFFI